MIQSLTIDAPAVFQPLDQPSRYKGPHGGRGSGKSWHAATMLVLRCLKDPAFAWSAPARFKRRPRAPSG